MKKIIFLALGSVVVGIFFMVIAIYAAAKRLFIKPILLKRGRGE